MSSFCSENCWSCLFELTVWGTNAPKHGTVAQLLQLKLYSDISVQMLVKQEAPFFHQMFASLVFVALGWWNWPLEREGLRHIKHAYFLPLQHPCIFDVCNCRLICAAFQIKDFGAGKGEGELEKGRERSSGLGREHFIFEAPPFQQLEQQSLSSSLSLL